MTREEMDSQVATVKMNKEWSHADGRKEALEEVLSFLVEKNGGRVGRTKWSESDVALATAIERSLLLGTHIRFL